MRRIAATAVISALALALVALLVFGVLQTSDDTSLDQAVARGERPAAHDARLPLLEENGASTLADLGGGGYVVVNFFASWCHPCIAEAALLNELQRKLAGRGTIVGVSWNDSSDDARAFADRHGVGFPIVRDVDGDFAQAYGVTALPETFVIDPEGRVVALKRSELTADWIEAEIEPLIAQTGKAQ
jgi:cytochrome c biogenesis protein CcmG, thiol:disulfide interchange protein DsbE